MDKNQNSSKKAHDQWVIKLGMVSVTALFSHGPLPDELVFHNDVINLSAKP
jgi:hypothetical protein